MYRHLRNLVPSLLLTALLPIGQANAQGDTAIVVCGAAALLPTYCYTAADAQQWNYESSGSGTMRLRFLRGTIESAFYDSLRIYDGQDNTGTLLYEHLGNTVHLGPVGSGTASTTNEYETIEVYASGTSFYMEMSSDGSVECADEFNEFDEWEWEVVCLDCTIPLATYTVIDDCDANTFTIPIDVANTGDGTLVNIVYSLNGGGAQTVQVVGVGSTVLGPFLQNDTVNVVVEHETNFLCNVSFGDLTDTGTCPELIACGTDLVNTVCYENNADLRYYYQGTGTVPLAVQFSAGLLYFADSLIIYDGGDITAPRLYASSNMNVTGVLLVTTNPEHRLTVQVKSDEFTSCSDDFAPEPMSWRVACYDCVPTSASFNIVQTCTDSLFTIEVVISDLGSDTDPEIFSTATTDTVTVTTTGTTTLGPFAWGTLVEVTIRNSANVLCNVYSAVLSNPVCPVAVPCPGPGLQETYCYTADDVRAWSYELDGGPGNLRLTFDQGTIESSDYDHIYIFDGPDNTAPILWSNTALYPANTGSPTGFGAQTTGELGPVGSGTPDNSGNYFAVEVVASGQSLYVELTSDFIVQCGSFGFDPWEWRVYCIDCDNPSVSVNLVPDCAHRAYNAEVTVTDAGADADLSITNLNTGDTLTNVGVGVHQFGPFPVDSVSVIQVFNQIYPQCRYLSDPITYAADSCVIVSCGVDQYDYCYGDNEDRWYTYQSAVDVPLTIQFTGGVLLTGDLITIYDGKDATGAPLFQGNNNGNSLAGLNVNTSAANTGHYITLRIRSNESGSCSTGETTEELQWAIGCGVVGLSELEEGSFSVYPNPTEGLLQIELSGKEEGKVQLRILDMSGRLVQDQLLQMNAGTRSTADISSVQNGQYMVQLVTANWVRTARVQVVR
ncbi:MAG: T9SS type A sorting domain-containing protein [Flavobacteriales bacterium]|nr:T9SS type A sorting domain-containing protein [Flavobacteriales bacterium]